MCTCHTIPVRGAVALYYSMDGRVGWLLSRESLDGGVAEELELFASVAYAMLDGHDVAGVDGAVALELRADARADARARVGGLIARRAEQGAVQGQRLLRQAGHPRRGGHVPAPLAEADLGTRGAAVDDDSNDDLRGTRANADGRVDDRAEEPLALAAPLARRAGRCG